MRRRSRQFGEQRTEIRVCNWSLIPALQLLSAIELGEESHQPSVTLYQRSYTRDESD